MGRSGFGFAWSQIRGRIRNGDVLSLGGRGLRHGLDNLDRHEMNDFKCLRPGL